MAITILSESYGPRKPLIECTADSLDELAALVCAEGSTATVGGTEYTLDRVNGWIVPGSGGGSGGGGGGEFVIVFDHDPDEDKYECDRTFAEIEAEYNEYGYDRMKVFATQDILTQFMAVGTREQGDYKLTAFKFSGLSAVSESENSNIYFFGYSISDDDTVTYTTYGSVAFTPST